MFVPISLLIYEWKVDNGNLMLIYPECEAAVPQCTIRGCYLLV